MGKKCLRALEIFLPWAGRKKIIQRSEGQKIGGTGL